MYILMLNEDELFFFKKPDFSYWFWKNTWRNILVLTGNGRAWDKSLIMSTDIKKKFFEVGCIL